MEAKKIIEVEENPLIKNRDLFIKGEKFFRVFKFKKKCISIGRLYFEKIETSLPIMRRFTGGGGVLHENDICFAFTARSNLTVKEITKKISELISNIIGGKPQENGDIIKNGKICGFSLAKRNNFFLVEGCIKIKIKIKEREREKEEGEKKEKVKIPKNCFEESEGVEEEIALKIFEIEKILKEKNFEI